LRLRIPGTGYKEKIDRPYTPDTLEIGSDRRDRKDFTMPTDNYRILIMDLRL